MAWAFMIDKDTNRCGLYSEAPGVVAEETYADPDSDINRPLNNPNDWLENIVFHSDFDYFQVHIPPTDVTITHSSLATGSIVNLPPFGIVVGAQGQDDHLLVTHNLGYIPQYLIAVDSTVISPGKIVQQDGSGGSVRTRSVAPYATDTEIRLFETMLVNDTSLASASITYSVAVFRRPTADSDIALIEADDSTGIVKLARGKFDSSLMMLRRASLVGDSPWDIPEGPTIDISNGGRKEVDASGNVRQEPSYDGSWAGFPGFQGIIA